MAMFAKQCPPNAFTKRQNVPWGEWDGTSICDNFKPSRNRL